MRPVVVLILHPAVPEAAGPLVRAFAGGRRLLAERQRTAFLAAGADRAEIVEEPAGGRSFGERLAALAARERPGGLVVLGSGSVPLARPADLRRFVEVAAGQAGRALANNRFSADIVAISRPSDLEGLPPLPADNALPRWLEERAGVAVADLRLRWRLGVDIDSPADLLVLGLAAAAPPVLDEPVRVIRDLGPRLAGRVARLTGVLGDRRAELLVAGRVSAGTLRWLEGGTACRVRALVEERGLRAASRLAQADATGSGRGPRSVLGELLDRDGPKAIGRVAAGLGDAAVIDTRVLMAHRCGAVEAGWPSAEDRFASDLLRFESIADPWLRALTESAAEAPIPILLGGHTLLNGGLRLVATAAARTARRADSRAAQGRAGRADRGSGHGTEGLADRGTDGLADDLSADRADDRADGRADDLAGRR